MKITISLSPQPIGIYIILRRDNQYLVESSDHKNNLIYNIKSKQTKIIIQNILNHI